MLMIFDPFGVKWKLVEFMILEHRFLTEPIRLLLAISL